MTVVNLQLHEYKYFPYELRLAALEASRLLGSEPRRVNGSLCVQTRNDVDKAALTRLTYIRRATIGEQLSLVPQQAQLEASASAGKDPDLLRRQSTRYSAHGLHEYRGKFNPQIVRAALNLLGLDRGASVWDPFCGSGTVLLEALHQGFDALGVDRNPLAPLIANAKLAAVRSRPKDLERATSRIVERIASTQLFSEPGPDGTRSLEKDLGKDWLHRFACSDYLSRWFPRAVLAQFRFILDTIDARAPSSLRDVYRVVLSDIAREVSWQDPGDLRIRRRKNEESNYPATQLFVSALEARIHTVLAARECLPAPDGFQLAVEGDSCDCTGLPQPARAFLANGVDCVLSSPPYATALPYVDTQRLSIALLGLASPAEIRQLDGSLVGSREIGPGERRKFDLDIDANSAGLADEVWRLCRRLRQGYNPTRDGFRRKNTPAVVYRYFAGMTRALRACTSHLKPGGWLAFVVGPNRTVLGGKEFTIDTPGLLAAVGCQSGLDLIESLVLDAYGRFDVHSRNSIREERLVVMRRPKRCGGKAVA